MVAPAMPAYGSGVRLSARFPGAAPCGGPGSPLGWSIRSHDRLVVITLAGELDAWTAPRLGERITPMADTGAQLVLHVKQLSFCGAAGLALFLHLHQRAAAAGGWLQLAAASCRLRRLILRIGLADVLDVRSTVGDMPEHPTPILSVSRMSRPPAPPVSGPAEGTEAGAPH